MPDVLIFIFSIPFLTSSLSMSCLIFAVRMRKWCSGAPSVGITGCMSSTFFVEILNGPSFFREGKYFFFGRSFAHQELNYDNINNNICAGFVFNIVNVEAD